MVGVSGVRRALLEAVAREERVAAAHQGTMLGDWALLRAAVFAFLLAVAVELRGPVS